MRVFTIAMLSLVAAATGACDDSDTDVDSNAITYWKDVKPLVDAKCTGCHAPDGIAPFALQTVTDVTEHAGEMLRAIDDGIMPPWPPSAECNSYHADRSLSAEQKALFRAWVDGGTVAGDASEPGPPLDVEQVKLTRVDAEMALTEPYLPQTDAQNNDDYRCFVIPWPETETRFVTGFRAVPGNPKVVHHVIAFLARPDQVAYFQRKDADEAGAGYTCYGGAGGAGGGRNDTWLGAWAPGTLGSDSPAGSGVRVEPGSAVVLQIHYNVLQSGPEPDQTRIQFKLDPTVDRPARIQPWANPSWLDSDAMLIPAGDPDVQHQFGHDATGIIGGPFTIQTVGLHMHQLGTRATATVERADGSTECLLQIDDWNFHWQGSYALREPVDFDTGDKLRIECHFDNSPENQPMVNGRLRVPEDVTWGESTTDEMCLGIVYTTPR